MSTDKDIDNKCEDSNMASSPFVENVSLTTKRGGIVHKSLKERLNASYEIGSVQESFRKRLNAGYENVSKRPKVY